MQSDALKTKRLFLFRSQYEYVKSVFRRVGNLRKGPVSFTMSVRIYQLGYHRTDFSEIRYWGILLKSVKNSLDYFKIGQKYRILYVKILCTFMLLTAKCRHIATGVTRTRQNVVSYLYCLFCFLITLISELKGNWLHRHFRIH